MLLNYALYMNKIYFQKVAEKLLILFFISTLEMK